MKKRTITRLSSLKSKLSSKFFIVFIIFVVVPSLLFGISYYNHISENIINDTVNSSWNNLELVEQQLSTKLQIVNKTFSSIYNDEDFVTIVSKINLTQTWGEQYDDFILLDRILSKHVSDDFIYQIRVYLPDDKFYSNQNTRFCSNKMLDEIGLTKIKEYNTNIIWMVRNNFKETQYSDEISLVSAFFTYKNKDNDAITIEIDIEEEKLKEITDIFYLHEQSSLNIVSKEGTVISTQDKKLLDNDYFISKPDVILREGINFQQDKYYLKKNVSINNWYIIIEGSTAGITRRNSFIQISIIILIAQIVLAFTVTSIFFLRVNKRLNVLRNSMNEIDDYINMKPIKIKSNDEIGQLVGYFSKMIDRIRKLIEEIYNSNREKRQSELMLLLSQINPHFIYNTLETINWKAIDQGAYDVSKSINQLSKFLRMSLSISDSEISMKQELKYIGLYIEMQKEAISKEFEFMVTVDEELADYKVPKLIIQPIIENSIIHGILEGDRNLDYRIELKSQKAEDYLHIEIYDNGSGIDKERLSEMMTELEKAKCEKFLALWNINQRLKINYGNECGLHIISEKNKYTIIKFKIPIIK